MNRRIGASVPPLARPSDHNVEGKREVERVYRQGAHTDDTRMERIASVPLRFIRFTTIRERTGLSRSTIWRLERRGAFPRHHRMSTNAVGWLEHEVDEWCQSLLKVNG